MRLLPLLALGMMVLAAAPAQAHTSGSPDTATCSGGNSCTTGQHNAYWNGYTHGFYASPRFTGNIESKITSTINGNFQTVTCSVAGGNPSCNTQGAAPMGPVVHTCRLINGFGTWNCFITHRTLRISLCAVGPFCIELGPP